MHHVTKKTLLSSYIQTLTKQQIQTLAEHLSHLDENILDELTSRINGQKSFTLENQMTVKTGETIKIKKSEIYLGTQAENQLIKNNLCDDNFYYGTVVTVLAFSPNSVIVSFPGTDVQHKCYMRYIEKIEDINISE
jgi:hypothetical protein